jgi:hypothetical protein
MASNAAQDTEQRKNCDRMSISGFPERLEMGDSGAHRRTPMQYLLLIYNNDAVLKAASKADQEAFAKEYGELNQSLMQSGVVRGTASWPGRITTVKVRDGEALTTDGPFAETREGVGGFFLVDVPDLDSALEIAARIPSARAGAVEVRPVIAYPAR